MQALLRQCPNLIYFNIEHSEYAATDGTMTALADSCRHLKTLSVAGCILITRTGLVYAFQRMTALKELSLAQCADIEAAEMANALSNLRNLRVLSLESTPLFPFILCEISLRCIMCVRLLSSR